MYIRYTDPSRPYPLNAMDAVLVIRNLDADARWSEPLPDDLNAAFEKALEHVSDKCRGIIVMKFRDNMTYKAIADELGKTQETCRQNLHKGLRQLGRKTPMDILRKGAGTAPVPGMHNLPAAVRNAFARKGIQDLGALAGMTYKQAVSMRGIGDRYIGHVMAEMQKAGVTFRPDGTLPDTTEVMHSRLSTRAQNTLQRAGIRDLAQLDKMPEQDARAIPGMGRAIFQEVRNEMISHGLDIRPSGQ